MDKENKVDVLGDDKSIARSDMSQRDKKARTLAYRRLKRRNNLCLSTKVRSIHLGSPNFGSAEEPTKIDGITLFLCSRRGSSASRWSMVRDPFGVVRACPTPALCGDRNRVVEGPL